ncbi:hypothetical protein H6775_01240 [Candidatus Nomurabacteria bacterium]|nr:hypothetical protein [Candidatus Nomurabacteria bacterium]
MNKTEPIIVDIEGDEEPDIDGGLVKSKLEDFIEGDDAIRNMDPSNLEDLIDQSLRATTQFYEKGSSPDTTAQISFLLRRIDELNETKSELSTEERALQICIEKSDQYPDATRALIEQLVDNGFCVRAEFVVDTLADSLWKVESRMAATDILFSMGRRFMVNPEKFASHIETKLNFTDPDKYAETSNMIEALQIMNHDMQPSWYHGAASKLLPILEQAIESNKGSYFLNLQARQTLEEMRRGELMSAVQGLPIELAPNCFAFRKNGAIWYLSPSENREKAELLASLPGPRAKELSPFELQKLFREMPDLFSVSLADYLNLDSSDPKVQRDIADYTVLTKDMMRKAISEEFDIDITDFDLREQFYFLKFIKEQEAKDMEYVRTFVRKFKEVGLRTFLSLQHNRDLGKEIIIIGHELPQADAQAIFEKYSEIVDVANEVENYIYENVQADDVSEEQVATIRDNVLKRGTDLLVKFSKEVRTAYEKGEVIDSEEVKNQLETYKRESILFASTFRGLREGLPKDKKDTEVFDIMKNVSFETITGDQFSEQDVRVMDHIFDDNYSSNIGLRDLVKESFHQRLENPEVNFYVVRNEGRIISFLSLQPSQNEKSFH